VPSEDANVNVFARTRFWRGTGPACDPLAHCKDTPHTSEKLLVN
jgi:hypothetical protein